MDTISFLVVDDHAMVAVALAKALATYQGLALAGVVVDAEELDGYVRSSPPPAVALVDYWFGAETGADIAMRLAATWPRTRFLIISADNSPEQLRRALDAGCVGFVTKSKQLDELANAVVAAAHGKASFDAHALREVLKTDTDTSARADAPLSDRETEVLGMLAAGLSTDAMAAQLFLSQHTVRNHVRNLTAKLGAHSRLEAVSIAARGGLVSLVGER